MSIQWHRPPSLLPLMCVFNIMAVVLYRFDKTKNITVWICFVFLFFSFFFKWRLIASNEKDTCLEGILYTAMFCLTQQPTWLWPACISNGVEQLPWPAICINLTTRGWWCKCKLTYWYIVLNHLDCLSIFLLVISRYLAEFKQIITQDSPWLPVIVQDFMRYICSLNYYQMRR